MISGPLGPDEVLTGTDYEAVRPDARAAVVAAQRARRVRVGSRLTLVFESRDTIRQSLQELIRAERVTDAHEVSAKIDDFNALVPQDGQLAATLYVEASDAAELGTTLADLAGVQGCVSLEIEGVRISGETQHGDAANELAAASFMTFQLPADAQEAWRRGAGVTVVVAHAACAERAALTTEQRSAIAADL